MATQDTYAVPTHSRGPPALPFYRVSGGKSLLTAVRPSERDFRSRSASEWDIRAADRSGMGRDSRWWPSDRDSDRGCREGLRRVDSARWQFSATALGPDAAGPDRGADRRRRMVLPGSLSGSGRYRRDGAAAARSHLVVQVWAVRTATLGGPPDESARWAYRACPVGPMSSVDTYGSRCRSLRSWTASLSASGSVASRSATRPWPGSSAAGSTASHGISTVALVGVPG